VHCHRNPVLLDGCLGPDVAWLDASDSSGPARLFAAAVRTAKPCEPATNTALTAPPGEHRSISELLAAGGIQRCLRAQKYFRKRRIMSSLPQSLNMLAFADLPPM
jgi:hypothetical protein